ncbi:uncharacterized protein PGTG_17995 [Puccinia graminis f. sp. tritici CRL 75-36-700-3]|uniref:Uncharacterized protein n=1 Tax=Puccinia graminis f. sp. tritici (strain CRL 75-36-700-3 / race SCCL) TaxID=418459 RepID=E3L6Z6_PUCGT|nr:uncharacterized protein PGTG_17995 [Puccinia graminis f. sp. tritici CRL 75-36-700-3]EFP92321.1 hypothetical protein PGTG_17995 [Puccinia graminis f. sp. tritici CRL 75-36-700-3]
MLRLPIIILACFTPNYILAAPTELANLAPPPTVFGNAPGPFMETALYQDNLLRNRKLLLEAVSVPSPMSAPIPKQSMDRNEVVSSPTPVQAELIRWFMKTRYGGAFTLNDDFTFHERHKKCCEEEYRQEYRLPYTCQQHRWDLTGPPGGCLSSSHQRIMKELHWDLKFYGRSEPFQAKCGL